MSAMTTTQRFDRFVPNYTCQLADINEHLLCALCSGYLVDATTIIECLHTFCRSCIVRYLESSETCPVCDVPLHQTNPLLGIRSDTTLQMLVYKLVPGIYKDEVKRRCIVINNAHKDGKAASIMDRLLKDICDMTTGGTIYAGDEKFSVCLQYSPSDSTCCKELCSKDITKTNCQKLEQSLTDYSYLLCPASLTVAHLKKLIRNKLELSPDLPLELYHSSPDESIDDCYTLADVAYITAWTGVKPMHFFYRVNAKVFQAFIPEVVSEELVLKNKPTTSCKAKKINQDKGVKRVAGSNSLRRKNRGVVYSTIRDKVSNNPGKKKKVPTATLR